MTLPEMPTFRNQMRVKCELSFAAWGYQPDVRTSQRDPRSQALKVYPIWTLVLYWKILFGKQIHNCSKAFLFNKLTYMLQLLVFIRPSSFQLISGHKGGHYGEFSKPVVLRGFSAGECFPI